MRVKIDLKSGLGRAGPTQTKQLWRLSHRSETGTNPEQSRRKEEEVGELGKLRQIVKIVLEGSMSVKPQNWRGVFMIASHRCHAPPTQHTHYRALSPCHHQTWSPTARGQQRSKSLLKPAVVNSFCSISRQGCCHCHCYPRPHRWGCAVDGDFDSCHSHRRHQIHKISLYSV